MTRVPRRLTVWLCAWGLLATGIPGAQAQPHRPMGLEADELPLPEQPGVVPDPDEERLPAAYQRQLVFFRTAEPPGTIIISTSERFLYLVQGNNRRRATASELAVTASNGRACFASRARRNGPIGFLRRR